MMHFSATQSILLRFFRITQLRGIEFSARAWKNRPGGTDGCKKKIATSAIMKFLSKSHLELSQQDEFHVPNHAVPSKGLMKPDSMMVISFHW